MPSSVAPVTLNRLREIGSRFALIDVREHGEFNAAHIPGASSVPRRMLESRLERACGTKVTIEEGKRKGRGKIVIEYYSLDDFERGMEKLGVSE